MLLSRARSVCAGRRGRTPMGVAHPVRIPRAARAASGTRARCILCEFPPQRPPRSAEPRNALCLAHAPIRRGRLRRFGRRRGSAPILRREESSWVPPRSGSRWNRKADLESRLRDRSFQPSPARNPTCPSVSCVFPEPARVSGRSLVHPGSSTDRAASRREASGLRTLLPRALFQPN